MRISEISNGDNSMEFIQKPVPQSSKQDLVPNREGEAYKLIKQAAASGKVVSAKGLSREEFKAKLLGNRVR